MTKDQQALHLAHMMAHREAPHIRRDLARKMFVDVEATINRVAMLPDNPMDTNDLVKAALFCALCSFATSAVVIGNCPTSEAKPRLIAMLESMIDHIIEFKASSWNHAKQEIWEND